MKIGYLHKDQLPLKEGSSVQSWQIYNHLLLKNTLYTLNEHQFSGGIKSYKKWYLDLINYINSIDILFTIIDGQCNWRLEKFTVLGKYIKPSLKTVWLINAPANETLIYPKNSSSQVSISEYWRRLAAKYVDLGICVSKNIENYITQKLHIKKTGIVTNGSDPDLFDPKKKYISPLSSIKKFKIFWSGNAEYPWQGINKIVDVAKKIRSIDSEILFIIMTNNSYFEIPLTNNILQIPLTPYFQFPNYLNDADICLCLYNKEPYAQIHTPFYNSPMKLFDYMSMEKPIIASNLGQIPNIIINNKNGILTDNSVNDIVRSILYLKHNRQIRIQMGNNARADIVKQYNWDNSVNKILKIIQS
jgi:glycosyltransferase involved in cell wall biosynthesis